MEIIFIAVGLLALYVLGQAKGSSHSKSKHSNNKHKKHNSGAH